MIKHYTSRVAYFILSQLVLVFCICSCHKEHYINDVMPLTAPAEYSINDIKRRNDTTLIAVGGKRYERAVVLLSSDNGTTWQLIAEPLDKTIFSVCFINDTLGLAACLDGKLLKTIDGGYSWQVFQSYWADVYDADLAADGTMVACGSSGARKGLIYTSSDYCATIAYDTSAQHALRSVQHIAASSWLAAGYGTVLASDNSGVSWHESYPSPNDFYIDISKVNAQTLYVAGFAGTIIKTKDAGASWEKVMHGNRFFSERIHLNAIHFFDENNGAAVGQEGIIMTTNDAGKNWYLHRIGNDIALHSVLFTSASVVLVGGNDGVIYKIKI